MVLASKKELEALIVLAGKVDPSLQNALKKAQNGTTKTANSMNTLAKSTNKFVGKVVKSAAAVGLGVALAFSAVAKEGIQVASNLNEVQNVVDVSFGKSSEAINKWSQTALNSYGLSELQAKKFSGTMGAMLKSSGIAGNSLLTMSKNITGLAGDFASFYNLDNEEAFNKIRSGISGETEPLKQLGINMSVANLEAFALSKGIKTAYKSMDQASQMALRYSYLMEVSKDAQGDFTRTQGSFANQTRLLQTNLQQLAGKIMQSVLPTLAGLAQRANNVISSISSDPAKLQNIQIAVKGIADGIGDVIEASVKVFKFIADNWSIIEPIILGIVSAIGAWVLITNGLVLYNAIMAGIKAGTIATTLAQLGLNAAVLANPMTWIVLGVAAAIGVLVAGIYLLWKNWDKVSKFFVGVWQNYVLPFFVGVGQWFAGLWDGIKNGFRGFINFIIKGINMWIKFQLAPINLLIKALNKIPGIKIPEVGFKIPEIPAFASGGFANRPSIFGEAGLEAAIPIKYKNPRSLSLLNQTAKAIGANGSDGGAKYIFNFSPVVSGSGPNEIKKMLEEEYQKFKDMMEQFMEEKARESFA